VNEPELVVLPDAEAVAARAADDLVAAVQEARGQRGAAHVCLAGGTTPMRCYEVLDERLGDWAGVHLWYGDERCVPYDDPDSNHGQVVARLRAPGATWHPMPATLGPDAGAAAYERELGDVVFDHTHLGMGPDGHTASLFPDHPLLDATGRVAGIHDSPKPPPERITLTLPALNGSRRIALLATGDSKAEPLGRVLAGPDRSTPASLLARDRLEVLVDQQAAPGRS
jgi:6-phosphogluconolactonase